MDGLSEGGDRVYAMIPWALGGISGRDDVFWPGNQGAIWRLKTPDIQKDPSPVSSFLTISERGLFDPTTINVSPLAVFSSGSLIRKWRRAHGH